MKESLLSRRALALVIDLSLLLLPAAAIVFFSAFFLPPEMRESYLVFISKITLLLAVVFYYLIQFFASLVSPSPGQRLAGIRRVSPGAGSSALRFFLLGALPMTLFILFSLWPLLLLPLITPFFGSDWRNPLEEKISIYFVLK